jgi:hypothetical protein
VLANTGNSNDGDVNGNGHYVTWLLKLNKQNGNVIWNKIFISPGDEGSFYVFPTSDGGFVSVGPIGDLSIGDQTNDVLVLKLNTNGKLEWRTTFGGSDGDFAESGIEGRNGKLLILCETSSQDGDVHHSHGNLDTWIVMLDKCENNRMIEEENINSSILNNTSFSCFPNPFSVSTTLSFTLSQSQNVSIKVFDLKGKLIKTLANNYFEAGNHSIEWNVEDVGSGIYFVTVKTVDEVETFKIYLQL